MLLNEMKIELEILCSLWCYKVLSKKLITTNSKYLKLLVTFSDNESNLSESESYSIILFNRKRVSYSCIKKLF